MHKLTTEESARLADAQKKILDRCADLHTIVHHSLLAFFLGETAKIYGLRQHMREAVLERAQGLDVRLRF